MSDRRRRAARYAALAGAAAAGVALWWRYNPSPCPYACRWFVDLPRPFVTRRRLRAVLAPSPGERVLEVGPGTGFYTLPVGRWVAPGGAVHALDVQRGMAAEVARNARREGVETVAPAVGDAQALPYATDAFDAAFLVLTLGEVPDRERALAEFRRVVRPGGRLVVGELLPDPHWLPFDDLRVAAERQGFTFERRSGPGMGYFARFGVPAGQLPER